MGFVQQCQCDAPQIMRDSEVVFNSCGQRMDPCFHRGVPGGTTVPCYQVPIGNCYPSNGSADSAFGAGCFWPGESQATRPSPVKVEEVVPNATGPAPWHMDEREPGQRTRVSSDHEQIVADFYVPITDCGVNPAPPEEFHPSSGAFWVQAPPPTAKAQPAKGVVAHKERLDVEEEVVVFGQDEFSTRDSSLRSSGAKPPVEAHADTSASTAYESTVVTQQDALELDSTIKHDDADALNLPEAQQHSAADEPYVLPAVDESVEFGAPDQASLPAETSEPPDELKHEDPDTAVPTVPSTADLETCADLASLPHDANVSTSTAWLSPVPHQLETSALDDSLAHDEQGAPIATREAEPIADLPDMPQEVDTSVDPAPWSPVPLQLETLECDGLTIDTDAEGLCAAAAAAEADTETPDAGRPAVDSPASPVDDSVWENYRKRARTSDYSVDEDAASAAEAEMLAARAEMEAALAGVSPADISTAQQRELETIREDTCESQEKEACEVRERDMAASTALPSPEPHLEACEPQGRDTAASTALPSPEPQAEAMDVGASPRQDEATTAAAPAKRAAEDSEMPQALTISDAQPPVDDSVEEQDRKRARTSDYAVAEDAAAAADAEMATIETPDEVTEVTDADKDVSSKGTLAEDIRNVESIEVQQEDATAEEPVEEQKQKQGGVSKPAARWQKSQSILAKVRAFEAAAKAQEPEPFAPPVTRSSSSAAAARLRSRRFGGDTADPSRKPLRKLYNVTEQKVLKAGVTKLHDRLALGTAVADVPTDTPGSRSKMLGAPYLRRLLSGHVELKQSHESDVCAAQLDVRHLSPEQLLRIRSGTLDLATESQSHSARNSFLTTVDRHLFEKLAKRCLLEEATVGEVKPETLHTLGVRLVIVVGAVVLLEEGWGSSFETRELPPLPSLWVVQLAEDGWPEDYGWGVFDVDELRMQLLPGEQPDFAAAASGGNVVAVRDRTTGIGKDRMLSWEIAVFDPSTDDVLTELQNLDGPTTPLGRSLTTELSAALAQRSTGRVFEKRQEEPTDRSDATDTVQP